MSMYPPVFTLATASAAVTSLLGSNPTRLYPFGEAPQGVTKPYAVWQLVGGVPENYLGNLPDADNYSVQVDAYAPTATEARNVAEALRDVYEPNGYITNWNGERRDPDTNNYRVSFDVDFIVHRPVIVPPVVPSFTVTSPSVTEGDDQFAVFDIQLSDDAEQDIQFGLALQDGTAEEGVDFETLEVSTDVGGVTWTPAASVTIQTGNDAAKARVTIIDDSSVEGTRAFSLAVTTVSGDTQNASATGTCTISEDDSPPMPTSAPVFDGNAYATMDEWHPQSMYFSIRATVNADSAQKGIILGQIANTRTWLTLWDNSGSSIRNQVETNLAYEIFPTYAGDDALIEWNSSGNDGGSLEALGELDNTLTSSSYKTGDSSLVAFDAIGSNSAPPIRMNAQLKSLELLDNTPIPSGATMPCNGGTRFAQLDTPIIVGVDDDLRFECWIKYQQAGSAEDELIIFRGDDDWSSWYVRSIGTSDTPRAMIFRGMDVDNSTNVNVKIFGGEPLDASYGQFVKCSIERESESLEGKFDDLQADNVKSPSVESHRIDYIGGMPLDRGFFIGTPGDPGSNTTGEEVTQHQGLNGEVFGIRVWVNGVLEGEWMNDGDTGNQMLDSSGNGNHATWYEGASPMTTGAANAARVTLESNSRVMDLGTAGEISYGGTQLTLVGLDASDWQPV